MRTSAPDIHHVKRVKCKRAQVSIRRERIEALELLLQIDNISHRWFENKKLCIVAILMMLLKHFMYIE
ncbi:hypothetical protein [Legionella sainthelensi]|uniref:hypothetical protein n=1 Tax=Legionella sainthelensi TaxID=28087 RepID=UPI001358B563|nr:hypothetical protein [Legionella sainthelensi]